MLTRGLNRIFLCLQEGLIGYFFDYKQPNKQKNKQTNKQRNKQTTKNRPITKSGLRAGGLASKAHQKITKTGLRNGISHESEAGKNPFLRPVLLRKNKGFTTNQIANQA